MKKTSRGSTEVIDKYWTKSKFVLLYSTSMFISKVVKNSVKYYDGTGVKLLIFSLVCPLELIHSSAAGTVCVPCYLSVERRCGLLLTFCPSKSTFCVLFSTYYWNTEFRNYLSSSARNF